MPASATRVAAMFLRAADLSKQAKAMLAPLFADMESEREAQWAAVFTVKTRYTGSKFGFELR